MIDTKRPRILSVAPLTLVLFKMIATMPECTQFRYVLI